MKDLGSNMTIPAAEKGPGRAAGRAGLGAWLALARVSFHPVGILPFLLGVLIAWRTEHAFRPDVLILSLLAVLAILAATHFAGEYHDLTEDSISAGLKSADEAGGVPARKLRNKFSGGSGIVTSGVISPERSRAAGRAALAAAAVLGLVIYFGLKTGPLTIPFGAVGILCGYFYSTPPIRWVKRGLGEAVIGFAYGWLPIACSFYLMAGKLSPAAVRLGIPIGLTIFNVILINEFPDHDADRAAGKRTLVVRCGKRAAAVFYAVAALGISASFVLAVLKLGLPGWTTIAGTPVMLISLAVAVMMTAGGYRDPRRLEIMCALTIMVNLASNMVFIAAYLF